MAKSGATGRPRRRFERRIITLLVCLALPCALFGAWTIWQLPLDLISRGVLILALLSLLATLANSLRKSVVEPLRGLTNVVEAYRGGDYTIRSSRDYRGDALGDLVHEVNTLGQMLHSQRLRAVEASALLEKLIAAIDISVLAFDGDGRLRLLNPAASQLLGVNIDNAASRSAADLGLDRFLSEDVHTTIATSIAERTGRWQVTHGTFREDGLSQHLLIIADVRQALREEERSAWQKLIRVISHEVNNSLAPIKSLAETLQELLGEALPQGRLRDDALPALCVISGRTQSLQRFLAQHSRLARLPAPRRRWFALGPLLARVAALEHAHKIAVKSPDDLEVWVDEDQLEQALINLVKNAVESRREADNLIVMEAAASHDAQGALVVTVLDQGPGIANPDNLFVPFFTTKPDGSGVGLLLSRQIAEAHGGTLNLQNRTDRQGAVATLELPAAARRFNEPEGSGPRH